MPDDPTVLVVHPAVATELEKYCHTQTQSERNGRPTLPRPAPRRAFAALEAAFASAIPSWVAAAWACRVSGLGAFDQLRPWEIYDHALEAQRQARAAGAPRAYSFFSANVYEGGERATRLFGFENAPLGAPNDSTLLVEYRPLGGRLEEVPFDALLRDAWRENMIHDWDAGIPPWKAPSARTLRKGARRAPFSLRWEGETPASLPFDEAPPPDPTSPPLGRATHPLFGEGAVVGREGEGDAAKLVIDFASGRKTVLARFVSEPARAVARPASAARGAEVTALELAHALVTAMCARWPDARRAAARLLGEIVDDLEDGRLRFGTHRELEPSFQLEHETCRGERRGPFGHVVAMPGTRRVPAGAWHVRRLRAAKGRH